MSTFRILSILKYQKTRRQKMPKKGGWGGHMKLRSKTRHTNESVIHKKASKMHRKLKNHKLFVK